MGKRKPWCLRMRLGVDWKCLQRKVMSTKEKLHIGSEELHGTPAGIVWNHFPQRVILFAFLSSPPRQGRGNTHKQLTSLSGLKLGPWTGSCQPSGCTILSGLGHLGGFRSKSNRWPVPPSRPPLESWGAD